MKRIVCIFLISVLCFSLFAACAEKKAEDSPTPEATGSDIEEAVSNGAGEYHFSESCIDGISRYEISYTVELKEDGAFAITASNSITGETISYMGSSYEWKETFFTTGAVDSEALPAWFNPDGSCLWINAGNGDVFPMNYMAPVDVRLTEYKNLVYAGDSDSQVLDVYLPEAEGTYPVIVVCHGGGFKFGDQGMSIIKPIFTAATERGYAVVSVDYRKSMEAPFPAALSDVKAAVRWVRANAETLGFDPDNIAIWGESAGAYLALMTALTPEVSELNGDVDENLEFSSAVGALVSFYAPVDFWELDADAIECGMEPSFGGESSFESDFVGQAVSADEEFTRKTWWGSYSENIPAELMTWIQAGDADHRVPYLQSVHFADELSEILGKENVNFGIIEGADHEDSAFYTNENLGQIFDFLDGALK